MLIIRFLFANIGFIISIFSGLVFFSLGLLYFDSSNVQKKNKNLIKRSLGFFLLAISSVGFSVFFNTDQYKILFELIRIFGLLIIWLSLMTEPILSPPINNKNLLLFIPLNFGLFYFSSLPISAILFLAISITYFRKAEEGYEKQLKPASIGFLILSIAEFIGISFFWKNTSNVYFSKILSDYNLVWSVQQIIILLGLVILARWAWGYIRFRLQIQLFITTVTMTLIIFIITTAFFTSVLLKNIEDNVLSQLTTDARVLQYSIEKLQEKILSDVQTISQDEKIINAFIDNDKNKLYELTSEYLISKNASSLFTIDKEGNVIMSAEDKDKTGNNILTDPIVKNSIEGRRSSTITIGYGNLIPSVEILAASPIKNSSDQVIGAISTGIVIDNAFVDGLKKTTGLDISVYSGEQRSATTFIASDGLSRFLGTKETNSKVINTVLKNNEIFTGAINVLNQPYYAVYAPLKSFGDKPIGMLFIGKLQTTLFESANKSLELTFLGSLILMILSIIPAFYISKYINKQIEN